MKPVMRPPKGNPSKVSSVPALEALEARLRADTLARSARIGIITALPEECAAVRRALREEVRWTAPGQGAGRSYYLGEIPADSGGQHPVVVALLPDMGNNSAAVSANNLLHHFPTVRNIVMSGIAGGVPRPGVVEHDVRLGDVVVSNRNGVIQYDLVKEHPDGWKEHRHPPRPPGAELLDAVRHLQTEEKLGHRPWERYLGVCEQILEGARPGDDIDARGNAITYPQDPRRTPGLPRVFLASIAAANTLLQNRAHREFLSEKFGVKAIEMEGSGVADATWASDRAGYLVVRGICDYCDENKGDAWHGAAAAAAAAYVSTVIAAMQLDHRCGDALEVRSDAALEPSSAHALESETWPAPRPASPLRDAPDLPALAWLSEVVAHVQDGDFVQVHVLPSEGGRDVHSVLERELTSFKVVPLDITTATDERTLLDLLEGYAANSTPWPSRWQPPHIAAALRGHTQGLVLVVSGWGLLHQTSGPESLRATALRLHSFAGVPNVVRVYVAPVAIGHPFKAEPTGSLFTMESVRPGQRIDATEEWLRQRLADLSATELDEITRVAQGRLGAARAAVRARDKAQAERLNALRDAHIRAGTEIIGAVPACCAAVLRGEGSRQSCVKELTRAGILANGEAAVPLWGESWVRPPDDK